MFNFLQAYNFPHAFVAFQVQSLSAFCLNTRRMKLKFYEHVKPSRTSVREMHVANIQLKEIVAISQQITSLHLDGESELEKELND